MAARPDLEENVYVVTPLQSAVPLRTFHWDAFLDARELVPEMEADREQKNRHTPRTGLRVLLRLAIRGNETGRLD